MVRSVGQVAEPAHLRSKSEMVVHPSDGTLMPADEPL